MSMSKKIKVSKGKVSAASPNIHLPMASPVGVSDRKSFPPDNKTSTGGSSNRKKSRHEFQELSDVLVYDKRNSITPDTIQSSQTILDTDVKNGKYEYEINQHGDMGTSGIDAIGDEYSDGTPEKMVDEHMVGHRKVNNTVVSGRPPLSRLSRNAPVALSQDDHTFVGDSYGF